MIVSIFKKYTVKKAIIRLGKKNPDQLSVKEYEYIANVIIEKKGCNMLVYGVGFDSEIWIRANKKGKTYFIENSVSWLVKIRTIIPKLTVSLIEYTTVLKNWKRLLKETPDKLLLCLPINVLNECWDIIFIDGPAGFKDSSPGRMQSIYTSSVLAINSNNIDIFVHDCDRLVEMAYCDHFFADLELVSEFDRLRHYKKEIP